jgi:3-hydroxybutyryl-CoA dehydrogenase
MADRHFVIEAVAENRDIKAGVLRTLDQVVTDPEAILATNTSSIPIVDLAVATERPTRVLGMHEYTS